MLNKSSIVGATMMAMCALPALATAEPTGYNQVSFSTEAKQEVANDELRASLYKKIQANNSKDLSRQMTEIMNKSLAIAKKYKDIEVTTGQQSSYPRYDKNGKITGWTGQASIDLKTQNFQQASQLIADLQDFLVIEDLNFVVSEQTRDKVQQQLRIKATQQFQQQANIIKQAWKAKSYRLINVSLNSDSSQYPYARPKVMGLMMADAAAVPQQDFASGNSVVSVSANGTIELEP